MHLVAFLNPPAFLCITAVFLQKQELVQSMKVSISHVLSSFAYTASTSFFFLTHMLLLLVFVTSFNLFSLPFSLVSTSSHGPSFLIIVPFLTFLLILIFLFHFLFPYLSFTWTSFFPSSTLFYLIFTCFLPHLFISSPKLIPFPRLIVSCPFFTLFQKWTGDKVMRPHSQPIPRFDPLVTGASRVQGIVGYAMAEQLWRGQGSASPDDGLLPWQRRWRSGCQGCGRLCSAPDGAWRWENWGKGRGRKRDIKNENWTKTGLKSKRNGGKKGEKVWKKTLMYCVAEISPEVSVLSS